MAKITRIATTVTARYFPGQGASDAFFLDGRLTGKRESRAADITLDREERGSFFSVFAHQASAGKDSQSDIAELRPVLDKILNDVKRTSKNIDAEINELADCGVSVAGRMTLQHAGVRQPYFSGVVIKDQEIAAITIGRGCAYLFRNDVLYPLTDDDFEMEEIDAFGRPVDGMDMYCAGVAGTVRYSNIAQLQMDDCLIVCNREVMDALGQREVLRILYEAEDQCDAAGMIITEAAAKSPGSSLQFMIGFVESATVADKPARGFGIGRGRSVASQPTVSSLPVAPADLSDVPALFDPARRAAEQAAPASDASAMLSDQEVDAVAEGFDLEDSGIAPVLDIPVVGERAFTDRIVTRPRSGDGLHDRHEDVFPGTGAPVEGEDDGRPYGRSRVGMYLVVAAVAIATVAAIYLIFLKPPETTPTTVTTIATTSASTTAGTSGTSGTTVPSLATPSALPGATTLPQGGTIKPGTPTSLPTTYTVVSGDTLFRIASYFYGTGDAYYIQLIKDANGLTSNDIAVGVVLKIPAKP